MARMIPSAPPSFNESLGEKRVFNALRSLPDEVTVIYSLRWIHPGRRRMLTQPLKAQGEGDFVLFDPRRGVLVVEVKGGEVWCERGRWFQRNRKTGAVKDIDPEKQSGDTMYRIKSEVDDRVPTAKSLLFCHAVWFPDGTVDRSRLPMNYRPEITLDAEDVSQAQAAIGRAFAFWASLYKDRGGVSDAVARQVFDTLAPTFSLVPSVRQRIDETEERLVRLTDEQTRIIGFLDDQAHAAIVGPAGTGKTLLAVEKARRLASSVEPVLFLCYNAALRDHLSKSHQLPNVRYQNFHGFAREITGHKGTLDEAVDTLLEHLADDEPLPYDHLVLDEAQDFHRDWLEFLQARFRDRAFYAFYDPHQNIQGELDTAWLDSIPCRLNLSRNCRNTLEIARSAYRAAGLETSPNLGATGPKPVIHRVDSTQDAVKLVNKLVANARTGHGIPPNEIAVLTLESLDDSPHWSQAKLGGKPTAVRPERGHVTLSTVRRFKGLEATVVIIVDVDFSRAVHDEWRRRLYVACSRARQFVHVIARTKETELAEPVRVFAGSDKVRPSWSTLARHLGARIAGGDEDDPFVEPRAR